MNSVIPGRKTFKAIKFLFIGPLLVPLLFVINLMTLSHSDHFWFQWAALGIGIAWFRSLFRVLQSAVVVGGLAALGFVTYRHFTKQSISIPSRLA